MSLNWNAKDVPAWDKMKPHEKDAVIYSTMWLDMGEITENNYVEFCDRARIYDAMHNLGAEYKFLGDPKFMKKMIGLRVNVITKSMRQWFSRQYKGIEQSRKREQQPTKEER